MYQQNQDRKIAQGNQNLQQMAQQKQKKAIIVVGRMGHGKSSFINTLTLPKNTKAGDQIPTNVKNKLLPAGTSMKNNITTQFELVQVHDDHNLLEDQKLYAIDTPGLNSENVICLVSQQIDNIIIQKKCQVVGIAYLINLSERQVEGNKSSTMKQFMKLIKMRKQFKNKLIFFILSNWDVISFKYGQKEIQIYLNDFYQFMEEVGIPYHSSRIIKWVSPYYSKQKTFRIFMKQFEGKKIIDNQWSSLKKMIKICSKNSLSLKLHIENIDLFWKNFIERILSEVQQNSNVLFKQDSQIVSFEVERKIQFEDQIGKVFKIISASAVQGFGLAALGVLTAETGLGALVVVSGLAMTGLSIIALPIVGIAYLFRKKQKNKQSPSIKILKEDQKKYVHFNRIIKKKLIEEVTLKLKISIIKKIQQSMQISNDKIIFSPIKDLPKIQRLDVYYRYEEKKIRICQIFNNQLGDIIEIKVNLSVQQLKNQILSEICSYKYRTGEDRKERIPQQAKIYIKKNSEKKLKFVFELTCYLPKEQYYYEMVKEQCQKIFGEYK